jgi:hypothetical protein
MFLGWQIFVCVSIVAAGSVSKGAMKVVALCWVCCIAYLRVLGRVIPISKYWYHLLRDEFEKIEPNISLFVRF